MNSIDIQNLFFYINKNTFVFLELKEKLWVRIQKYEFFLEDFF